MGKQAKSLDELMNIVVADLEGSSPACLATRMTCFVHTLMPITPSAVKSVLFASNVPKHLGIDGPYRMMKPWIGDGLLVSNGRKWERNRRLLTPAFHFDILKPYVAIVNTVADTFLDNIAELSKTGISVDVYPVVSRATLDTMLRCTLSYNDDSIQNTDKHHPYVVATHRLSHLLSERVMNPVLFFDFLYSLTADGKEFKKLSNYTQNFSANIIESRRKSVENDPSQIEKRYLDFLDILLTAKDENGIGLTQQEIQDEMDTFVFEGHDTTASAISWAINSLAKYPDMQEKVREEVIQLLDGRSCLKADDLTKLRYTTCFIKETLRMYSAVPSTMRKLIEPLLIDGVTFQPGDNIAVSPYCVHHNPAIWDNHMEFRPERFLPENNEGRDPFAFIAFAAGKRFKATLDETRIAVPYKEIIMRATDGIYINFERMREQG